MAMTGMITVDESFGAGIDRQIAALGNAIVERSDRLAADLAQIRARIESYQRRMPWIIAGACVLGGIVAILGEFVLDR
jgi:hypothetical protein